MSVTTQQVLERLQQSSLPSSAMSFSIGGYENNLFLKDWCMLVGTLYLINEVFYEDFNSSKKLPKPKPYQINSFRFDASTFSAKADLELDNFNIITNYQRDENQPFNGVTAEPLNLLNYQTLVSPILAECLWLLVDFSIISPMQFVLDSAKVAFSFEGEESPLSLRHSNESTAMVASIKVQAKTNAVQIPSYNELILYGNL